MESLFIKLSDCDNQIYKGSHKGKAFQIYPYDWFVVKCHKWFDLRVPMKFSE